MQRKIRIPFTFEEDTRLRNMVAQLGTSCWREIAKYMPNRNARQCKDRWEKYLSPNINLKPFTEEEDAKLLELYETIGPKWKDISNHMNGRTDNSIKSRFKLLKRRENMFHKESNIFDTKVTDFDNIFDKHNIFDMIEESEEMF